MNIEDWSEDLKAFGPLRMSHVAMFLHASGRTETCPFCGYRGEWDFHIQWPSSNEDPDEDPLMAIFEIASQRTAEPTECVAITCPQCAHFSMLDLDRIKEHLVRHKQSQVKANG